MAHIGPRGDKLKRRSLRYTIAEVTTPIALVGIWAAASSQSKAIYFPPLTEILDHLWAVWLGERIMSDIVPSLLNLVAGFMIAATLGVVFGIAIGLIKTLAWALEPLIHFIRAIPPLAMVPIFIVLIGFGAQMNIIAVAVAAVFPTLLATIDGIRGVDAGFRDVCTSYHLKRFHRLRFIYVPAASPQIFAGLLVSLQISFLVMIASEMLGSTRGIGAQTILAQQTFAAVEMWSGIVLLGLLGYAINIPLVLLKNRVLSWSEGARKMAIAE